MTHLAKDNAAELAAALAAIGIRDSLIPNLHWPVFEDNYMKFMSNGGASDEAACDDFEAWLDSQGFSYERHRDRAIRQIDPRAVTLICKLWGCEDDDAPMPDPSSEWGDTTADAPRPLPGGHAKPPTVLRVPATPSGAGLPAGYVLSQDQGFNWWLAKLSGTAFPGGPRLIGRVQDRDAALEVALFTIEAHRPAMIA